MLINMIGSEHVLEGTNKQDIAFKIGNVKVALDGCGSGKYSEVGATLFMHYFIHEVTHFCLPSIRIENIVPNVVSSFFEETFNIYSNADGIREDSYLYKDNLIYNNFLFTILVCIETKDEFVVYSCGDGFILTLDNEDKFGMQELEALNEYPAYYAYNFIQDKTSMIEYKNGVNFKERHFSKEQYKNVGVASDGIRFVRDLFDNERVEFNNYIVNNKTGKAEMFIKRHQNAFKQFNRKLESKPNIFKDDISIVF